MQERASWVRIPRQNRIHLALSVIGLNAHDFYQDLSRRNAPCSRKTTRFGVGNLDNESEWSSTPVRATRRIAEMFRLA
jgi:hypothetical protein